MSASHRQRAPSPGEPAPEDTRSRCLRCAWEAIAEDPQAAVSLVDLAQRAGVSRQTLYLLFEGRAGLLMAMVDDMDARSPQPRRLAELRNTLPPREALEPYLRTWFDYLPRVFPVARALAAAATSGDAAAAQAWASRLDKLRGGFRQLMNGLQAEGALRAPWTAATAADWLLSQTHVDVWQHLVVEARWPPKRAVDTIVRTVVEGLVERA